MARMCTTLKAGQILSASVMPPSFMQSLSADNKPMSPEELQQFLSPTDGDYVRIPVRMLSAAQVQNNTIDFSHMSGAALKDSVDPVTDPGSKLVGVEKASVGSSPVNLLASTVGDELLLRMV